MALKYEPLLRLKLVRSAGSVKLALPCHKRFILGTVCPAAKHGCIDDSLGSAPSSAMEDADGNPIEDADGNPLEDADQ